MDNFAELLWPAMLQAFGIFAAGFWSGLVANPWPWIAIAVFMVLMLLLGRTTSRRRRRYR